MALAAVTAASAAACQADSENLGFTLQYRCAGQNLVVTREEFENQRVTLGPGFLGCNKAGVPENSPEFTWAQMSYMPDDKLGKMPTWVELRWLNLTPDFEQWSAEEEKKPVTEQRSPSNVAEYNRRRAALPSQSKRIDLTPLITPDLVARVKADRRNTQLKLTFTFNNEQLNVKAEAYKWR
jgi:hypothetical protein